MTTNAELEELYRRDPEQAVTEDSFPGLSKLEQKLLVRRDENFVQVAAKGSRVQPAPSEKFARDLYSTSKLAGAFRAQLIAAYQGDVSSSTLDAWVDAQSPGAKLSHFAQANSRVNATSLLPWTGVYASSDGSFTVTVIASHTQNALSSIYFGETQIKNFGFNNSTLSWRIEDGNTTTGRLVFSMPERTEEAPFVRSVVGHIWPGDAAVAIEIDGNEIEVCPSPMVVHAGRYRTEISSDTITWSNGPSVTVVPLLGSDCPAPVQLSINDVEVVGATFDGESVTWNDGSLQFIDEGTELNGRLADASGTLMVRGTRDTSWSNAFHGRYLVWMNRQEEWARGEEVEYDGATFRIGSVAIHGAELNDGRLSWTGGGGDVDRGSLQMLTDPATGLARFIGSVWKGDVEPKTANMVGTSYPPIGGNEANRVKETLTIPQAVWKTIATIGSETENPAVFFLWSRISRAHDISRFVNRLALDIVAELA